MPADDREKQFERALARHLRDASPDSACPDAETLAAYHERTLSLEEMARWKAHIAECTRCQKSLALVEQSEDVRAEDWERQNASVPVEDVVLPRSMRAASANAHQDEEILKAAPMEEGAVPIRKTTARPKLRWIVPVGALAAGVIVWIGVREMRTQRSHQMDAVQVAQNRQAPPQTPRAENEIMDQLKREEPTPQKLDEELRSQKAAAAPPSPSPVVPQPMGPAASSSAAPADAFEAAAPKQKDLGGSNAMGKIATPKPVPPPSAYVAGSRNTEAPPPPSISARAPAAVASGVAGGAVGGAIANRPTEDKKEAPVRSMNQTVEMTAAAPQVETNATSVSAPPSRELAMNGREVANLALLPAADRRYIVAPGEKLAWRVGDAGKIERSTDRGKTWKLQKSGLTADLTAGSATSDKVCWVVGKGGTVLLTTDGGKHWKQSSSPSSEDLGGIHATDALHASIWDVPNRRSYETTDGGETWKRTSTE